MRQRSASTSFSVKLGAGVSAAASLTEQLWPPFNEVSGIAGSSDAEMQMPAVGLMLDDAQGPDSLTEHASPLFIALPGTAGCSNPASPVSAAGLMSLATAASCSKPVNAGSGGMLP